MPNKTIRVGYLARVEGEGGLRVHVRDGRVTEAHLNIFEPPRFFEAILRGRRAEEAPDITSRICGICPVAYQMSAITAVEDAYGVRVGEPIRALRRLLYCGEWIESHALHVFMLHAPDFLGYADSIAMARDHPDVVKRGLAIKKAGNALMALIGGREIHPINVRVGGFYRAPAARELRALVEPLARARDDMVTAMRWLSALPFPDFEREYEFVALRHEVDYPLAEGRVASSVGLDIAIKDYEEHFEEVQVPYSHALQSVHRGHGAYLTGPMARYALNFDRLSPLARETAQAAGLGPVCRNPFKSILVRGIEIVYALDEALRLIASYEAPDPAAVETPPRAGTGYGATEAPRGLLYHRYQVDEAGLIREAKIVPPTAQNQRVIEDDLRQYVNLDGDLSDERLTWDCEHLVRNHDPCISCSAHFLNVTIERDVGRQQDQRD